MWHDPKAVSEIAATATAVVKCVAKDASYTSLHDDAAIQPLSLL